MADTNESNNSQSALTGNSGASTPWLVAGLLVAGGIAGFFYWRASGPITASVPSTLSDFRAAMVAECKLDQFAKPADNQLLALYADSSRMQGVIAEQSGILKRGQPNCDHIVKVLKSVNYPVE